MISLLNGTAGWVWQSALLLAAVIIVVLVIALVRSHRDA